MLVAAQAGADWRDDWAAADGFTVEADASGFEMPTAIAFVPRPGAGPADPLYFVTELRGTVKVVSNDRTVRTFAKGFFRLEPEEEIPLSRGEIGLAGICLDPAHGYVFVTFAYEDASGVLRNNIVRFGTSPETFAIEPTSRVEMTELFAPYRSSHSHQIGPCQVHDDHLYVSVGDGHQPHESQNPDALLGKVLRMTLDGKPVVDNPFFDANDPARPRGLVWAYGFRNPFGLELVGSRVFVAQNGLRVDGFLEARAGENFLWDGTDWSIGANSALVLAPGPAPVQLDYLPAGATIFPPEFTDRFYLATSGALEERGPGVRGARSVLFFRYDFGRSRMASIPGTLLKYRGDGRQAVVGLAFGPDGLYVASLMPDRTGETRILRVRHDPGAGYPHRVSEIRDARFLMEEKGCLSCHRVGEVGGTTAPALDPADLIPRLRERLGSSDYDRHLADLAARGIDPGFQAARDEVLRASGATRIVLWVKNRLLEPRFDDPGAQMPKPDLTETEALIITQALLQGLREPRGLRDRLERFVSQMVPVLRYRHLAFAFLAGLGLGGVVMLAARRSRRRP